jgi:flavin-dependent dehydrogenase
VEEFKVIGITERRALGGKLAAWSKEACPSLKLDDDSRVAVIGSGPAGSFFSYFLLNISRMVDMDIHVDIYDSRDFSIPGPTGCNMCGGIISETLIQNLAVEGIILPPTVIQRGIDSYILHTDVGKVRIDTPLQEKRIGAVYRGSGPRDVKEIKWGSFDGYLQKLAAEKGAHLIRGRVVDVSLEDGKPQIRTREGATHVYDLLAVAVGVNSGTLKLFQGLDLNYQLPRTTKTFIREYYLGEETVARYVGSSMHVFLLNIPRLEFAALVPKGDYVSLCLLGEDIDSSLIQSVLDTPEVKECLPSDMHWEQGSCQCAPYINIHGAENPYANRIVFIGDSGVTRLYKDGIGAAYRTAKAAATTAVFHGISVNDFKRYFRPTCQAISIDNMIGKMVFAFTRQIQKRQFARRAVLRMVSSEQQKEGRSRRMSTVLWDMFTGSAPYREILIRTFHPFFLSRFLWDIAISVIPFNERRQ